VKREAEDRAGIDGQKFPLTEKFREQSRGGITLTHALCIGCTALVPAQNGRSQKASPLAPILIPLRGCETRRAYVPSVSRSRRQGRADGKPFEALVGGANNWVHIRAGVADGASRPRRLPSARDRISCTFQATHHAEIVKGKNASMRRNGVEGCVHLGRPPRISGHGKGVITVAMFSLLVARGSTACRRHERADHQRQRRSGSHRTMTILLSAPNISERLAAARINRGCSPLLTIAMLVAAPAQVSTKRR
jgi:hypothetical protein